MFFFTQNSLIYKHSVYLVFKQIHSVFTIFFNAIFKLIQSTYYSTRKIYGFFYFFKSF